MGIVMQNISCDKVAWAVRSTSGNLSLFPDRKETTCTLIDDEEGGGERSLQYISTAIATEYFSHNSII